MPRACVGEGRGCRVLHPTAVGVTLPRITSSPNDRRRRQFAALEDEVAEIGIECQQDARLGTCQCEHATIIQARRDGSDRGNVMTGGFEPARGTCRKVLVEQNACHAEAESAALASRMNDSSLRQSRTKANTACRSSGFKCG